MEIPLPGEALHLIAMSESVRVYLSFLYIIIVELDLANPILVVLVDMQQVVVHQDIGDFTELSVVVTLRLHVLDAEI